MKFTEKKMDLFDVDVDYYLAHCISADFKLGAGIAVEFVNRFDMRNKLNEKHPRYVTTHQNTRPRGECLLIENVLNLVTKERAWYKPTIDTFTNSILQMKKTCIKKNIKKIAMPTIGCGLDGLQWPVVKKILKDMFRDTDIEILVCIKQ